MKKTSNCKHSEEKCRETKKCLNAIEALIKVKPYRELGMEMLNELDKESLCHEHQVDYQYLNGRYFLYRFKDGNDLEDLEWANDYFDDMASQAYEKKVKIDDPRYHFSRAFAKYKLSLLVWDDQRKPWLLDKASKITENALRFNPNNNSFNWLKGQINA